MEKNLKGKKVAILVADGFEQVNHQRHCNIPAIL